MILGLTGGIATGKSTVSEMFRQRGADVIDADQVARQIVEPGGEALERIARTFGEQVIQSDRTLNRAALAQIIFQNPIARKKLNQLLHPLIRQQIQQKTRVILGDRPQAIVIWDIPLLIESNLTEWVEQLIVVYAPEPVQQVRLMKRNALSIEEATSRISAQLDIEEKKKMADWVIDNSSSLEHTERQVDELWNYLTSKNG